jgi:lysozyme
VTTPFLLQDLREDEGLRLRAYPDPISHGEPWTVGYGHTGPDVGRDTVWTKEAAEAALAADVAVATADLDRRLPWWRALSDLRQDVLANMAFNLGVTRLLGFEHTLRAIEDGAFEVASECMLASAWARQVGARAIRLAAQMRTGSRPT